MGLKLKLSGDRCSWHTELALKRRNQLPDLAQSKPSSLISASENQYAWDGGKLPAGVTVREDLPIEVRKARESLYAEADRLRENKNNRVAFSYPARLMLNGKVHKIAHPIDF